MSDGLLIEALGQISRMLLSISDGLSTAARGDEVISGVVTKIAAELVEINEWIGIEDQRVQQIEEKAEEILNQIFQAPDNVMGRLKFLEEMLGKNDRAK